MRIDESNLILQLKKKNPRALDYMVDRYSNLMFKVAYSVLYSKELAEECVNEALLKVWNSIDSFDRDKSKFVTWIVIITKYTAIDCSRRERKHKENISIENIEINDNFNVEEKVAANETKEKILKELKAMNEMNRDICIRRFFFQESIKKIAEDLKITESAVSNRLLREKKKLSILCKEEVS